MNLRLERIKTISKDLPLIAEKLLPTKSRYNGNYKVAKRNPKKLPTEYRKITNNKNRNII